MGSVPKEPFGILSVMRPDDLRIAIVGGDAKAISGTGDRGKDCPEI